LENQLKALSLIARDEENFYDAIVRLNSPRGRQSVATLTVDVNDRDLNAPQCSAGQSRPSPQLRVLGLGLLQDGNVGVGVF